MEIKNKGIRSPWPNRVEAALYVRLVLRSGENIAEQIRPGDSRHAAQPFRRNRVDKNQAQTRNSARPRWPSAFAAAGSADRASAWPRAYPTTKNIATQMLIIVICTISGWLRPQARTSACSQWLAIGATPNASPFVVGRRRKERQHKKSHHIVDHRRAQNDGRFGDAICPRPSAFARKSKRSWPSARRPGSTRSSRKARTDARLPRPAKKARSHRTAPR